MSSNTNQAMVPTAVLNVNQWEQINQAIAPLNKEQLTWVSGYLAGLAQNQAGGTVATPQQSPSAAASLTILYGSQTGNAKGLAQDYKAKMDAAGIPASLVNMADYKAKQIKSESHVVIVVSTHGEGDAPDDAVEFHEYLASKKAPKLTSLSYAVVGLGDSSYEFFCQTAKDFDERLAKLGATRLADRLDCDVDYETEAAAFADTLVADIGETFKQDGSSQVVAMPGIAVPNLSVASQQYSKKNPFTATLNESQKITGRNSVKDIRHIEISLEDSNITYSPGDALGVWFSNDENLVLQLLDLLSIKAEDTVELSNQTLSVKEALIKKLELTQSYPTFVKGYLNYSDSEPLKELFEDKAALREYLANNQIIDVVKAFPAKLTAQQLVDALRPLTPRLYSIASSQADVEDEVHLTVAVVEFDKEGDTRQGGASSFLSQRLAEGGDVEVFIEPNKNFRLPEDNNTPVIMVGPGTGIAPFRAFMQQRAEDEAEGKNWLFFGNPNFTEDFLYQTEWQRFVKDGVLDKVSLAFSRDQEQKVYVQHRLREEGKDVFEWLENGAHFYVCGDANHMAKDVHDALTEIIQTHGKKTAEEAEQYLTELRRAKRYQKDVY